jgi:hypothetical protein
LRRFLEKDCSWRVLQERYERSFGLGVVVVVVVVRLKSGE